MLRVRAGQVLLLRDTFVAGIAVGTPDVPATLYKSIHVPRSADIPDPYLGLPYNFFGIHMGRINETKILITWST